MIWFRFEACLKCKGDLALDDGDWICLQCGTYYYIGLYQSPPASIPSAPSDLYYHDAQQDSESNGPAQKSVVGREYSASKYLASSPADLL